MCKEQTENENWSDMTWEACFFTGGQGCGARWNWSWDHQRGRKMNPFCLCPWKRICCGRVGPLHGSIWQCPGFGIAVTGKRWGSLCIPLLISISLGRAKSGEFSETENMSLLCQQICIPCARLECIKVPSPAKMCFKPNCFWKIPCAPWQGQEWREWTLTSV